MGGPRLDYFALRAMDIGGTVYAVGDVVDVSAMADSTVTGLVRSGYLATTLKGDIRSAVVQTAEPASPQTNDLWIDSDAVAFPSAKVTLGANQSFADNTLDPVVFDTEEWDDDAMWDSASGSRLTVQTAGRVLIIASIYWDTNSTGDRDVLVKKNGTDFIANDYRAASTFSGSSISVQDDAVVSDYYEVHARQTSGGSLALRSGPRTHFSITGMFGG